MLDYLLRLNVNFNEFKTQKIITQSELIGFHCFGIEKSGETFSGGTSADLTTAKRIAVAESFERSFLKVISSDNDLRIKFNFDYHPTSSGFAAGFDREQTSFRSICEAIECWAWSKWIDENFKLTEKNAPKELTKLSLHFLKDFDSFKWYEKDFRILINEEFLELKFIVFLGMKDNGIYPGSRVSTKYDNLYEHPIIEAYRNYKNALIFQQSQFKLSDIIQERVIHFSQNKHNALEQIKMSSRMDWPSPQIKLLENFKTEHPNIYLYRCLLEDFIGWHEGDVTRFVY